MPLPRVATLTWRHERRIGNFGDALNVPLLRWLGFEAVAPRHTGTLNDGSCLFAIGSVICDWHIRSCPARIDVWGAGWRGEAIGAELRDRLTIRAVRGPRTAAALGCEDVPQGDPALLLPRFHPRPSRKARVEAILVPHFLEKRIPRPWSLGCDAVVTPAVRQRGRWIGWSLPTPLQMVDRIASADFVLAGALHGAILAQAYGVPWAAWSGSMIDCPAKWLDWFDYLGIEGEHVTDRRTGEAWWRRSGERGAVRPLEPLLTAFPYRRVGTA